MLINPQPLMSSAAVCSAIIHIRSLCLPLLDHLKTTAGCHSIATQCKQSDWLVIT